MQNLVIILYIIFWGAISGILWICLSRAEFKLDKQRKAIKVVAFFSCFSYFLISGAKWYLGEVESTLLESFWDIEIMTYIHYAVPLLALAVIMPLFMHCVIRKWAWKLIDCFDAVFFVGIILLMIAKGQCSNRDYCVVFILSACIAMLLAVLSKNNARYIEKKEARGVLTSAMPAIVAWIVTVGIYLPNELYLNNYNEFPSSYGQFFLIMFFGSILIGILFFAVEILFLPKTVIKAMNLYLAAVICMGYLQSMFLNGDLQPLDGNDQVWPQMTRLTNIVLWIIAIGVAVIAGYKKDLIKKILQGLCIYIALIQTVTLGYLMITTDYGKQKYEAAMTTQGDLEIAAKENVLVFVLDNFDSSWFEEIVEDDPDFVEPLADFTYYRNGTSQFAHTSMAIPYMLTGSVWTEETEGNYFNYAYENSNVIETLADNKCNIGIYTGVSYLSDSVKLLTENYSEQVTREYSVGKTLDMMINASMYKIMPFVIKPEYIYYSGDMYNMASSDEIWSIDNDMLFYNRVVEQGISVNEDYSSAFRFYHMRGPHAPFYLSDDMRYEPTGRRATRNSQGRGSMKIVYEYMRQLKELGLYDDATIIITADHGQGYILDSDKTSGQPDRTSRPIFFVKEPNQANDTMKISNAPVSQAELIPTIMKAFGIDWKQYGKTFDEIGEDEQRERMYVDIYDYFNVQYVIDGNAADLNSWSIKSAKYNK